MRNETGGTQRTNVREREVESEEREDPDGTETNTDSTSFRFSTDSPESGTPSETPVSVG